MARRTTPHASSADADLGKTVTDSAQKIWLAGLGAFERARDEGPKVFDTLVEQGKVFSDRAREAADGALKSMRDNAGSAGGSLGRIEQAIEERVMRSLTRLGVITRAEMQDLSHQVRDIAEEVRGIVARNGKGGKRKAGAKRATRSAAGATRRTARKAASTTRRAAKRATGTRRRARKG